MNFDQPKSEAEIKEQRKAEIISLARELSEGSEVFPFSGIDTESYEKIKNADEEYPGFATPIDEIIKRCQAEGIKVVLGKDPESGNVFILPAGSNDIESDSILPKCLQVTDGMDDRLKRLILLDRARY
ncbi:MAG: hypothetical protein A2541_00990 [Candidatus Taylorbacteria bacterium RIFOXYD2_FULL_36_9]|uniref:Uncharacterized protein n=1 Tax=Candidatus Taylorbacteria bacterium RIFOXYD2_FULL_36_9 TaxID=1802338 RepID=A0A1G2PHC1_9BACT|nr:MAG: hypothetical protein A2541_00990 [Candidatus Taylorbacteria bacterium RIFOXYD2_FULL_36_9]